MSEQYERLRAWAFAREALRLEGYQGHLLEENAALERAAREAQRALRRAELAAAELRLRLRALAPDHYLPAPMCRQHRMYMVAPQRASGQWKRDRTDSFWYRQLSCPSPLCWTSRVEKRKGKDE